jgi:hypothetical protein
MRAERRLGSAASVTRETGAVTGVQRFGSSLNVHVHFHVLCLDGVYVELRDHSLVRLTYNVRWLD